MKVSANLYYRKSKTPGDRIAIRGARNITTSIKSLVVLIEGTHMERATRIEIVATVPARRSKD